MFRISKLGFRIFKVMSLPLIIVGKNEQLKSQLIDDLLSEYKVKLDHPDVLFLSEKLGIDQVKKIREHLSWRPTLAKKRIVIINPADSLTIDAQNGLLKILEEPSDNAVLVLGVDQEDVLLPTILSRCEIKTLNLDKISNESKRQELEELLSKDIPDRLQLLEKIEDRKGLLFDLLAFYHQKILTNSQLLEQVKLLLEAEAWAKRNVPAKAITDYLMTKLSEPGKK